MAGARTGCARGAGQARQGKRAALKPLLYAGSLRAGPLQQTLEWQARPARRVGRVVQRGSQVLGWLGWLGAGSQEDAAEARGHPQSARRAH